MSDTRDTLPTDGENYPVGTSPTTYPTTPNVSGSTAASSPNGGGGGVETAKQEAANVAGTAKDEAKHVAATAKEEAKDVGREARTQASRLYHEARDELSAQAADRQDRLAQGLRSAGGELRGMADSSTDGGIATDLVRQASERLDGFASWLGTRDPAAVLDEVKRYARRRPGVFLAVAAIAGVAVGRLTRSLAAGSPSGNGSGARELTASPMAGTPVQADTAYTAGNGSSYGSGPAASTPTLRATANRGTGSPATDDPLNRSGEFG